MENRPLIIGHRGSSAVAPENTLAAFRQSILDGADGIEFDIRLSKDDVPVVIHDPTLARTASINQHVDQLTSTELQDIDAGAWFAPSSHRTRNPKEERIPTLTQVFELFRGHTGQLYLELKGEPVERKLIMNAARLIREYAFGDRVVVESFDLDAITEMKRIDPEIRTAALFERRLTRPFPSEDKILRRAQDTRANEIALHHLLVNERLVNKSKQAGFEVVLWTVDEKRWIERARNLEIKALISNNPALMLQYRAV